MGKKLPASIWALGLVSLFMDSSSELIHSLLPVFMVSTLGASVAMVGLVEGIAEATALIVKIFSGSLSDFLGKRKLLTLIGYGMAALSKPLFPLAHSVPTVLIARFIDRIGKGVRGAPRDALISDIVSPEMRGAAFGLRQALDTVGAVIGPLLAMLFMLLLAGDIRTVLWISVIPAFLCVATLIFAVKEPERQSSGKPRTPIRMSDMRNIGKAYWYLVAVAAALTLARFSEAFLILKAQSIGISDALVPMVLVVMSLVYSLTAYPAGKLSDRMERAQVLLIGVVFLIAADLVLAVTSSTWMLALGVSLWGLHMGFSQGLLAAMVADAAPAHLRGTAYGVYNFTCGIAMLAASVIAGKLWDAIGPAATFLAGAGFTLLAVAGLRLVRNQWRLA